MRVRYGLDQRESFAKFRANPGRIIAAHRQTAAAFRAVRREGPDDHAPAAFHHVTHVRDVPHPVVGFSQEVKDGAVVPDVHLGRRPWTSDVSLDPSDAVGVFAQPCPCPRQSGRGDVEYRDAAKATGNKVIHEAGIPAPNIEHSGCGCQPRSLQQSKGDRWLGLKPAHLLGGFRGVDTFPVCFAIHGAFESLASTSVAVLAGVRGLPIHPRRHRLVRGAGLQSCDSSFLLGLAVGLVAVAGPEAAAGGQAVTEPRESPGLLAGFLLVAVNIRP